MVLYCHISTQEHGTLLQYQYTGTWYFTAISVHRNIVLYCNISTQEHGKLIRVQVLHWDTSISSIFTLKGRHERCIQQQKTHNGEDNIYWC